MDQLIDIVDKYPVRNQAVLYLTLHYADMALPASVLRDYLPFDDDLYRLVEEEMMSFAILSSMLENILREFHTMKAEEISILLDDMERVGNSLYFNAIETFSDKHLLAAESFIAAGMKAFIEKNVSVPKSRI